MKKTIFVCALASLLIPPYITFAREPLLVPAERIASLSIMEAARYEDTGLIVADIIANPNGQSINAVFVSLDFATSSLNVVSLGFDNSFCELFIDQIFDNEAGKISIMCGKPYPGVDTEAVVGRIIFKKTSQEESAISFSPDSMVLANDGYGTDVLATTTILNIQ